YYPFGLTFNSYQRENSLKNRFKFQSQEHIDELDLGWDSFKWRNHMPEIGRFFNVDPLAAKYVYNSPYAFSENCVTSHIELEGLEKVNIKILELAAHQKGKTVLVDKQAVADNNVYNKNIADSPNGGDFKELSAVVETSDGSLSKVDTWENGDSPTEEFMDFFTSGDLNNFNYDLKGKDTKEGSALNGNIEGADFKTSISIRDGEMTFETTMSGGDTGKAYVIKAGSPDAGKFSMGFLKAGREKGTASTITTSIPFTTDKNGNAVFDTSQWLELHKKDQNESTKTKN
ncbi:MAG: RHS repeat-associated core domain-containing protein, partial [Bacteroidota bacterium]